MKRALLRPRVPSLVLLAGWAIGGGLSTSIAPPAIPAETINFHDQGDG
jgi:hypothetical protein